VIAFPNCKINLGLQVLQKRSDGFHTIETIFYPVPVKDALELIKESDKNHPSEIIFTNYGLPVKGSTSDNLCVKAWHLLKKDFPDLPVVQIHLLKNIPMGAGLGGGSSDGAFMLKLLNEKFHLNLSNDQLISYALQLGSDCPFFIINKPCYATGRGEIIEPVEVNLSGYQLIIANPGIHINTGWAFSQLTITGAKGKPRTLKQIIREPVSSWKNILINDFETPVFEKYPEIKAIKEKLYQQGAVYAAMSGSGSTVFALFTKQAGSAPQFAFPYTAISP
jgi:4-diphosphocytidyl-2-C-methyl-D-erythritol kinase